MDKENIRPDEGVNISGAFYLVLNDSHAVRMLNGLLSKGRLRIAKGQLKLGKTYTPSRVDPLMSVVTGQTYILLNELLIYPILEEQDRDEIAELQGRKPKIMPISFPISMFDVLPTDNLKEHSRIIYDE